jgi:uncharacterized membrane-anchored protein YitT (DUF2179 family)
MAQIFLFFLKNGRAPRRNFEKKKMRGVTIMRCWWYTNEKQKILMTVVRKRETTAIFKKIKEIDHTAFVSMGSVMGVYGEGFDQLKG